MSVIKYINYMHKIIYAVTLISQAIKKDTFSQVLVFKNNFSLFCHINQNFNVLLYKSFNKVPSDTKITIMLHRRTHDILHGHMHPHKHPRKHTCSHPHKNKNAPFLIWHFGHMEQFALICWFGWPCSARIALFS